MKQLPQVLVMAGLAVAGGSSFAASGYVEDTSKGIVRTGYGDCLHTGRWAEANAIAECDPDLVAARDKPAEVAAVETVLVKELKPIRLSGDALFEFDSATLTDKGRARLDKMLGSLPAGALQDKSIEISGHTDRIGDASYNQKLSEKRAEAVREYLVSRGLPGDAISATGVGSAQPVVGCEGERGAQLIDCLAPNRRTEIEFSAMEVIEVEKTMPAGQ